MTTTVHKCCGCQQTLPEGSGYCVACGYTNDVAYEKLIESENEMEARRERMRTWGRFYWWAFAFRIFR